MLQGRLPEAKQLQQPLYERLALCLTEGWGSRRRGNEGGRTAWGRKIG